MEYQSENKICQNCKKDFILIVEEISLANKMNLKNSNLCSTCLLKQQLSFWYFGKFRKGKSDLSGENIITIFSEKNCPKCWWSDKWDFRNFGMDKDFKTHWSIDRAPVIYCKECYREEFL